jgi:HAE1 family hydrophobic/amphiphilic exporter-1
MGAAISDINKWFTSGEIKLPPGASYRFVGQAENFQELGKSIQIAALMAITFIFLVLASLYESVVTPFVIMLVIPLAIVGGFFSLFIFRSSLDLFSMIGCIMLMGLATKNSIILVDYIKQKESEGHSLDEAILVAGKTRLRPILMTSLALIAGMIPVAIGLNEASSQRTSLGIAVIGGVAVSTILTLVVIPSVYRFIENTRQWMIQRVGKKLITQEET